MGGGYPLPHPPPARSLRSLAEDLRQMCPLRDFAPPKLKVFRRVWKWHSYTYTYLLCFIYLFIYFHWGGGVFRLWRRLMWLDGPNRQLGTFFVNGECACLPFVTKSGHADNPATFVPCVKSMTAYFILQINNVPHGGLPYNFVRRILVT